MGQISKQTALYIALLFVCSSFTLIFPFYPGIAESKGIDLWLIGLIFSLNPISKILITPFLGKIMLKIGRKSIVTASFILTGISMLVLSPIESCEKNTVLVLSVFSRAFSGWASGCVFISVTSIFITDYPGKAVTMIGRMEAAVGVGLTLGPVIGASLYFLQLFGALIFLGSTALAFTPIAWKMLGKFRELKIVDEKINTIPLLLKPRIFLSMLMDTTYLFSSGLLATILEVHLKSYDLDPLYVSLCFAFQSGFYLAVSLISGAVLRNANERLFMIIGVFCLALGYSMLGPWTAIYPNEVWVVILSLPIISIGQCFTYSICYVVFSIPYMQKSAVQDYGYEHDDIIDERICGYAVTACAIGEIIGPMYAGMISDFFSIETCCVIASGATFVYLIVYIFGSGYFYDVTHKRKVIVSIDTELERSVIGNEHHF